MKKLMMAAVALAVASAQADWDGKDALTTLKQNSKDSGTVTSITNATRWSTNAGATISPTAPCLPGSGAPNPDAANIDYYSATVMRTYKQDGTAFPKFTGESHWGGKSLHMGPGGDLQYAGEYPSQRMRIDDLWFHENSKMTLNANNGLTNSTITIASTSALPFSFDINCGTDDNTPAFCRWQECTLKGDADAVIWIPTAPANNSHKCGMMLEFSGNGDQFYGTFKIGSIDYKTMSTNGYHQKATGYKPRYGASMANATFDLYVHGAIRNVDEGMTANVGTVNLRGGIFNSTAMVHAKVVNIYANNATTRFGSTLTADKVNIYSDAPIEIASDREQTIGELNSASGQATIKFYYSKDNHAMGVVRVTDKFVGPVTLELDTNFADDALNYTPATIFTVAKSAFDGTLTADAFTLVKPDGKTGHLPRAEVVVEEDTENDRWNVKLSVTPYVTSVKKGAQSPTVFTDGTYWSDGLPVHNDADYYITNQWYSVKDACDFSAVMRSLTLNPSGGLWTNTGLTTFPDDVVMIGGEIVTSGSASAPDTLRCATSAGRLEIPAGRTVVIRPYGNGDKTLTFEMPMIGGGEIQLKNRGSAKPDGKTEVNYGSGVVNFMTANPDFKGRISLTKYAEGLSYPYTLLESTKFGIAEPESIGGTLDAFRADALYLSYYGTLKPLKSMTLSENSNRGIFVDWAGRVLVEDGIVFNVNNCLKIAGAWEKFGTGTLFLGASVAPVVTATTIANTTAKAMTELNVLQVVEGAVGATTKVAVEGLAVKFAAGAMLAADAGATGDAATYGLYNKTGTVSFEGDSLKVRILPKPGMTDGTSVAVLTVPTAQAAAFEGKLVAEGVRGYAVSFASAPAEGEGDMTTFTATLMRRGAMVFLK